MHLQSYHLSSDPPPPTDCLWVCRSVGVSWVSVSLPTTDGLGLLLFITCPRASTVLSTEETAVNGLETGSSQSSSTLFSPYNCHVNYLLSLYSSGIGSSENREERSSQQAGKKQDLLRGRSGSSPQVLCSWWLPQVISELERLRRADSLSARSAWATQERPCLKLKQPRSQPSCLWYEECLA